MIEQNILTTTSNYAELENYIHTNKLRKIFLVSGIPIKSLQIYSFLEQLGDQVVYFTDFQPNPQYESVVAGVKLFLSEGCDAVFAVGGGSAIQVVE